MCEHFGWSLEYVEGLPLARLHQWEQVSDGRAKGLAETRRREAFLNKGGKPA